MPQKLVSLGWRFYAQIIDPFRQLDQGAVKERAGSVALVKEGRDGDTRLWISIAKSLITRLHSWGDVLCLAGLLTAVIVAVEGFKY